MLCSGAWETVRLLFGLYKTIGLQGLKFGILLAVQAGTLSIGSIVLQRFMNGFGEQTAAVITTAYRIDSVIILPIVNFGSGIATIVAQNIGAGNKAEVKKTLFVFFIKDDAGKPCAIYNSMFSG